ncbi:MAG: hypothetical protein K2P81_07775 [Bacteriovoracaceae bacterium]|nr:hypothetical protein [Bacteriovoracaceae bacterium]
MKDQDFEGTLILEELASFGLLQEFYDAIDSDDLTKVISLMRRVDIDQEDILAVLSKIRSSDS